MNVLVANDAMLVQDLVEDDDLGETVIVRIDHRGAPTGVATLAELLETPPHQEFARIELEHPRRVADREFLFTSNMTVVVVDEGEYGVVLQRARFEAVTDDIILPGQPTHKGMKAKCRRCGCVNTVSARRKTTCCGSPHPHDIVY